MGSLCVRLSRRGACYLIAAAGSLALVAAGLAYGPSSPITVNATGTATPYPATVTISGITGAMSDVTVRLNDFSHLVPDDVDVLLVGPGGQSVVLMSDAGGYTSPAGAPADITFDDGAPPLPNETQLSAGTYGPTNYGKTPDPFCALESDPDTFPAPAPSGPYGASLAVFNGTDPNGVWSVYVFDDCATGSGSIAGGFEIFITTTTTVAAVRSMAARSTPKGVMVSWRTAAEVNVAGFRLFRGAPGSLQRVKVTHRLIPSRAVSPLGGRYTHLDRAARAGVRYTYYLQEVGYDGSRSWRASAAVRGGGN